MWKIKTSDGGIVATYKNVSVTIKYFETKFERDYYEYAMKIDGSLFAYGTDFSPSPRRKTNAEIVGELMFFLTLSPGETDKEFFENHSHEYLAWLDTLVADEIRMWVDDMKSE